MKTCKFCAIIRDSTLSLRVFENEQLIVIRDIHPQAPYHVLVIPKEHFKSLIDVPDSIIVALFHAAKECILREKLRGFRLINNGLSSAQIDHVHLHILGNYRRTQTIG